MKNGRQGRPLLLNLGVADGTRTHDDRNHNPGLYQLSYSHRRKPSSIARNQGAEAAFDGESKIFALYPAFNASR